MPPRSRPIATPRAVVRAADHLATGDPHFATLVAEAGVLTLRPPAESNFAALVRAIVFQQLAGAAATAIHRRLLTLVGDELSPTAVLRWSTAELRAVGLSENKSASIFDLSRKIEDGTLDVDERSVGAMDDDEIVAHLSDVRGIGPWTAQMFLIFQLRRLDVWPTGDLGVRRGYGLTWRTPMPAPKELALLGDRFRPARSIVALYCWRACDLYGKDPKRLGALTGLPTLVGQDAEVLNSGLRPATAPPANIASISPSP